MYHESYAFISRKILFWYEPDEHFMDIGMTIQNTNLISLFYKSIMWDKWKHKRSESVILISNNNL